MKDFEKRFSGKWVASDWFEVERSDMQPQLAMRKEKSIDELEKELTNLRENMFNIEQKQRMLENLSKLY